MVATGRCGAVVSGVLETDRQSQPRLELDRYLTNGSAQNTYPIVLGTTLLGDPITLEKLNHAGSSSRNSTRLPNPIQTEVLSVERVYVGAHLPEASDRTFRHASLDLTDLLIWPGESGLDEEISRRTRIFRLRWRERHSIGWGDRKKDPIP